MFVSFVCVACGGDDPAPSEPSGSGGTAPASGGVADPGVGGNLGSGGALGSGGGGSSSGGAFGGGSGGLGSGGILATGGDLAAGGSDGAGGHSGSGGAPDNTGGGPAFILTSPALENLSGCSLETPAPCDVFEDENVSYMERPNRSPELHWNGAPEGTQSYALVLFDVTYGQAHWALWNIPAETAMLAADISQDTATPATPPGSQQANANFATTSEDGYFGPHIPCNVFEFQLYALATSTFSPMDPGSSVLVSIELADLDSVLGVARLTGKASDYGMVCD